ncbi:MAG TPA: S53 family peptidase, partial [Thermoplasmata archaeon]|nr:S53 family peptidase [Thermoplasmata archaeon]
MKLGRPPRFRSGPVAPILLGLSCFVAFSFLTPGITVTPAQAAPSGSAPSYLLPAALAAPWAQRVDYLPNLFAQVTNVSADSAPVQVYVNLWPTNLSMFQSGTRPLLSPAEFESRYSPAPDTYSSLESYFTSRGWSVLHAWPNRMALTVVGPASSVPATFGAALERGVWEGHQVVFPSALPRLPGPWSGIVASITGLSEGFSSPVIPLHRIAASVLASTPSSLQVRTTNFTQPVNTHLIYGMDGLFNYSGSPHWATGNGIALVLWGWGYNPADLQTFFAQDYPSGFPQPTITPERVDNAPAPSANSVNDPSGAPFELTLDIEWAGSAAPGATLYPTYAPDGMDPNTNYSPTSTSLEDALQQAIGLPNVRAVSMSFGLDEGSDPGLQATFETDFSIGASQGITFLAASGDTGGAVRSNGSCTNQANPQYPGSSPQVISVGGTEPILAQSVSGTVTGLDSEPAWSFSGGGFSQQYSAPSWQEVGSAQPPVSQNGHRGIPDVAAAAAYNFVYYGGQNAAGSGTSFGSPLWAGIVTEMDAVRGTPFGFLNPRL